MVSGQAPPIVAAPREAKVVDRMVADFYGYYCDTVARAEVESIEGPNLYVRRYARLVDWVAEALGSAGSELWNHLLNGRGIWRGGNDVAFDDAGDAYFVGYVTLAECEALAPSMARASPPAGGEVEAYAYVARAIQIGAIEGHGLILEAG